jgi:hypothetical protein
MKTISRHRLLPAALLLLAAAGATLPGCSPRDRVRGAADAGGLIFAVRPPDASVVLDGVLQGKASDFPEERYLRVEGGTHRLELRKPGYETYVRDVYVSGSLLRIEVTLAEEGVPPVGGY